MRAKGYILAALFLAAATAAPAQDTTRSIAERIAGLRAAGPFRVPGSPEGEAAAEYIAGVFEDAGLYPFFGGRYTDEFTAEPLVGSAHKTYRNVAGIIYGSDFTLDGEYIVIGAHYDYDDGDDNATGVAVLLEMAGKLKECSPGRNIILVAFDGYEHGLLGSRHFVAESTIPLENIVLMIDIQDILQTNSRQALLYYGVQHLTEEGLNYFMEEGRPYEISINRNGYGSRSDTEPFTQAGIPMIHLSTLAENAAAPAKSVDYKVIQDVTDMLTESVCAVSVTRAKLRPGVKETRRERKGPRFEAGVTASAGTSFVRSSGTGSRGKTMFSYAAGLYGQLNVRSFGLRPEVQFASTGSRYEGGNIHQRSLMVPLNLVVQSPPALPVAAHIFAGGYYKYTFKGKHAGHDMDFDERWYRNGAGIQWGLGIRLNSFGIAVTNRYGLTDMLRNNGEKLTDRATYCTVTYTF